MVSAQQLHSFHSTCINLENFSFVALNYLIKFCVATDHRKSIIFKAYKHFMSKPENDKLSKILFN